MEDEKQYKLHHTTQPALQKMREHKESYETTVGGLSISVLPGVWSPAYDWSGEFMIENFPNVKDKDVLEIGCGSGLISVYAGLSGAKKVISVDINPKAVENTALNFGKHKIKHGKAFFSDGFEKVEGAFDLIIFNAPYHGSKPGDLLEYAVTDEDYRLMRNFFVDVSRHLRPNAVILLGFSESGDLNLFRDLIQANHFLIRRELSEWKQGYNCMIFELVKI